MHVQAESAGVLWVCKQKVWACSKQGILKGEVSLYCWPPVWLVWNQLYDNHRYQRCKNRLLKFVYVPATSAASFLLFLLQPFTVLMKKTCAVKQSIIFRCLWWQLTIFVFTCKTDQSKPVKQEVNSTVILPPLVFPALSIPHSFIQSVSQHAWLLY